MVAYDKKSLAKMYKEGLKAIQAGTADELDAALCVSAGYALDLVDLVNNSDGAWKLDLTADTEESVPVSISFAHLANLDAGKTTVESREDIIKKLAAYELFAIYNELLRAGADARFVLDGGVVKIESTGANGEPVTFDVYRRMRYAISKFDLASSRGADYIAYGTLQPFYDKLVNEFLTQLS